MVSIIVPVYNVEKYLKRCIESLICQTYKNVEIILVDDGSTDNSSTICDFYAQMDDRIKVIHKSNGGLSDARNAGIEVAKGEYFAFVDSDDYVSPDFIMLLIKACEENNADIAQCRCISVDGDEGYTSFREDYPVSCFSGYDMIKRIYTDNGVETIVIWSKLYRRHLYENIRFPKGKLHEDEFTSYKLFDNSNVVCLVAAELYFYRNNPNSIVRSQYKPERLAIFEALSERMEYFAVRKYDELISQTRYAYVKQLKIHITAMQSVLELSQQKSELTKQLKEMLPQVLKDNSISFPDKKELLLFVKLYFLLKIKSIVKNILSAANNLCKRVRLKIIKIFKKATLKNKDFSIVSNNCWGGMISEEYGLRKESPTVGLFITGKDYVKMLKNFEFYINQPLCFIPWEESRLYSTVNRYNNPYPVAMIDDVEIYFMHYETEKLAKEKWEKRAKRINKDNLVVKLSQRDECTRDEIIEFMNLPYKNKLCFTYEKNIPGTVYVPELRGLCGDEYNLLSNKFNIHSYLNNLNK